MVLEFLSSFLSRSYPSVRKFTDYCGVNMSTNMALKTRTRCYSFDQSVRKCNDHLVVNMISNNRITFPDRVVSTTVFLLLCETSCSQQHQEQGLPAAVPGLGTTDAKLHCCCCCWCCRPVLLLQQLLWFGPTHGRTVPLGGGHTYHVEGHAKEASQQAGPDIYRLTAVTERRL